MDLFGSAFVMATARPPATVPDYALQAPFVYRLELGAACFIAVYLAAMAFFLALDGRGFIELGAKGLKAEQVIRKAEDEEWVSLAEQMELQRDMEKRLDAIEPALERATEDLNRQKKRLARSQRRR